MAARKKTKKVRSTVRKARSRAGQAQTEGPAAFQEAVADGLQVLTRSRSTAERMIRDVLESAEGSVQTRIGSAREQAAETWDNLEALFQSRVQKALQQIGVPTASEIRLLTKRVAELNDNVKALSARSTRARRAPAKARSRAKARPRRAAA